MPEQCGVSRVKPFNKNKGTFERIICALSRMKEIHINGFVQ